MADTNDNGASTGTKRRLTDAEQDKLLKLLLHSPEEIKSYAKPAEGLDRIGPVVLAYLVANPAVAQVLKLDAAHLQSVLAERAELAKLEAVTLGLYRRAHENRIEHDSDLYRAALKVNRLAHNNADEEQSDDLKVVSKWVADNHAHGTTETPNVVPSKTPKT